MNILGKRPLSVILCTMMGSFAFFAFTEGFFAARIILAALPITVLLCVFLLPKLKRSGLRNGFTAAVCALSLFCMLLSFLYFDIWFKPYKRFENESVTIVATVTDMPDQKDKTTTLNVRHVNGKAFSAYKMKAHIDTDEYYNYSIGSNVRLVGFIKGFENSDQMDYYASLGICAEIDGITSFELVSVGKFTLEYKISSFRESITRRLIRTSDKESGGILSALLLGDREYLPSDTALSFKRLGITHILALSGMHLVMFAAIISKLLKFLGLGKRANVLTVSLFSVFYMILTGLSASIVRAGIMLIISAVLFLLSRTNDSVTSLFLSVFIIILIEPYAIYDAALWLSAFSTLGIIAFTDTGSVTKNNSLADSKPAKRALMYVKTSVFASLFAIAATFTISVLHFNEASLLSIPATLIFSVLTELFINLGLIHLVLGTFIPSGALIKILGMAIDRLADIMADIEFSQISVSYPLIRIGAVVFAVLFFGFISLRVKHKKTAMILIFSLLIALFSVSAIMTNLTRNKDAIIYTSDETEHFVIKEDGRVAIIDVGTHSERSASSVAERISELHLTYIDDYFFMNYSSNLKESAEKLITSVKVKRLYLPAPKSDAENSICNKFYGFTESHGVEILFFHDEISVSIGECDIFPIYTAAYDVSKETFFTVIKDGKMYTYISPKSLDGEKRTATISMINESYALVIGRRGAYRDFVFKYISENAEHLIIGSKNTSLLPDTVNYYRNRSLVFTPDKVNLTH